MYWTTHLQDEPRGDPTPAVTVGSKIYSFGWADSSNKPTKPASMQVHVLNTENLRWSKILPMPEQEKSNTYPKQRFSHSAVVYEDKIYVWGGLFGEDYFDDLLCFDTFSLTWSVPVVSGTIPYARHAHYAFVIGHSMYLIGGYDKRTRRYSPDVFVLDLEAMEWKYIVAQSGPYMWEGITACAVGQRIYIFGGELYRSHWNGGSFLDTETNKWHRIVICESCPLMWKSPAFVYGNSIYVFGGTCPEDDVIFLLKLSAKTNKWVEIHIPSMSSIPLAFAASIVVDSRVFVFGGKCRYGGNNIDLHILDFCPTLHLLCLRVVVKHKLETKSLPKALKSELKGICI